MRILKLIVIGAAVGYGINYILKKRDDGRSILDNLTDDAGEWLNEAKNYAEETIDNVRQRTRTY